MAFHPLISIPMKLFLAIVGTSVLALTGSSLFMASVDPRLVGEWRVTESTSFPRAGRLVLHRDGSAQLAELEGAPYSAVWKARGDLIEIALVARREAEADRAVDPGLSWRLRWQVVDRSTDEVQLVGPVDSSWPSGTVVLKRSP
jgi:hypothetical protein